MRCRNCNMEISELDTSCAYCGEHNKRVNRVKDTGYQPIRFNGVQSEEDSFEVLQNKYQKIARDPMHKDNQGYVKQIIVIAITTCIMLGIIFPLKYYVEEVVLPEYATANAMSTLVSFEHNINNLDVQVNANAFPGNVAYDDSYIYIAASGLIYQCETDFSSASVVIADYSQSLSVESGILYYINYDQEYIALDIESGNKEVLLENIYYPKVVEGTVYYQNDSENESIYSYNLKTGEIQRINHERSYEIIVDIDNEYIYYININKELMRMDLNGENPTKIIDQVTTYCLGNNLIYYVDDGELYTRDNQSKAVSKLYSNSTVRYVNYSNENIVLYTYSGIVTLDKEGEQTTIQENTPGSNVEDINVIGNYIVYGFQDYLMIQDFDGNIYYILDDYISNEKYKNNIYPSLESEMKES